MRNRNKTVLLSLAAAPAFAAAPYLRSEAGVWIAGNDTFEIAINKSGGYIQRLADKTGGEDYCNQDLKNATSDTDGNTGMQFELGERIAGLTLIDELRKKEFSDLTDPGIVSNAKQAKTADAVSLSFEKRYRGAEFVVTETFRIEGDHVRWDVRIRKTAGPDRTIRVVQFAPLPLGHYEAWAPISDAPFAVKPWLPFSIDYGQSTSGAVGEGRWRTTIPMMVFYSKRNHRALSFTSPFETPSVRIRFLTNTSAGADFHWNSRRYPLRERPYFQVSHEYLGARDRKDIEAGLLIAAHAADWRPALGWVYSRYKEYFDADPGFDQWEGSFVSGYPLMRDSFTQEQLRAIYAAERDRGARWEELHGHFPWYGLMIPAPDVKSWTNESHPMAGTTLTRDKIARHCRLSREAGIGTFLYYNVTESEHWYAQKQFANDVAKSEWGKPIGAFRAERYPDRRACWLMNADPSTGFGKFMIRQASEMVEAYPAAAGLFWDVYGRSYMFDFAHDDGITMINNKPAYYPEFMYQRLMRDHIRPLLRAKGMLITANKPVTVASAKGLDGIMAMEDAPREENPAWITAQSYLGLNRHVMILENNAANTEMMFLHCLRYGMFDTDRDPAGGRGRPLPPELQARNRELAGKYRPFIEKLRGKQWIFYPEALELPEHTAGNIFRLQDGNIMITMISAWRHLRKAEGFDTNLEVTCRLPDAAAMRNVRVTAVDLGQTSDAEPRPSGDTLRITVPRHAKATVILLSR
jgi:hypothetical protein